MKIAKMGAAPSLHLQRSQKAMSTARYCIILYNGKSGQIVLLCSEAVTFKKNQL